MGDVSLDRIVDPLDPADSASAALTGFTAAAGKKLILTGFAFSSTLGFGNGIYGAGLSPLTKGGPANADGDIGQPTSRHHAATTLVAIIAGMSNAAPRIASGTLAAARLKSSAASVVNPSSDAMLNLCGRRGTPYSLRELSIVHLCGCIRHSLSFESSALILPHDAQRKSGCAVQCPDSTNRTQNTAHHE